MTIQNSLCPVGKGLLTYFPIIVPQFKSDKIPNSLCPVLGQVADLLSNFCSRFQKWQNPKYLLSTVGEKEGGVADPLSNFCSWVQKWQNPKFPLSSIWGRGLFTFLPTFVPEFKNDKIQKILLSGRGVVDLLSNFCSWIQKWQNPKVPQHTTPSPARRERACYAAGGKPLAVTQEDFLVQNSVLKNCLRFLFVKD